MPYSTYEGKQFYIQLEEYIRENNINEQQIEKSEDKEYKLGNATWKCLNVDNSNPNDKNRFNDTSIVIKLDYGSTKYLSRSLRPPNESFCKHSLTTSENRSFSCCTKSTSIYSAIDA